MMNIRQVEVVLSSMRDLLRAGALNDWANAFEGCILNLPSDPAGVRSQILSMFGGMGSLNDLVLYRNG